MNSNGSEFAIREAARTQVVWEGKNDAFGFRVGTTICHLSTFCLCFFFSLYREKSRESEVLFN